MNLMHEEMARAHTRERLRQAHDERRGHQLALSQRLSRRVDREAGTVRRPPARDV